MAGAFFEIAVVRHRLHQEKIRIAMIVQKKDPGEPGCGETRFFPKPILPLRTRKIAGSSGSGSAELGVPYFADRAFKAWSAKVLPRDQTAPGTRWLSAMTA